MALDKEFDRVLEETILLIYDNKELVSHYEKLSSLLKQGARGNLYEVVRWFNPRMRGLDSDSHMNYMNGIEETIYFLLSEGVVPDIMALQSCCSKGDLHLLEDLLKFYEGPSQIDMLESTIHVDLLPHVSTVFQDFDIKLVLSRPDEFRYPPYNAFFDILLVYILSTFCALIYRVLV